MTNWSATYKLELTVVGKPPYSISIYSEDGTSILEAKLSSDTSMQIALSQGTYYLAVIGNENGSLAACFKRIELISDIMIIAKLKPISHYQIKEVEIQALYPNGSPAADISIMAYPIGLPNMLYMAKTDKNGFVRLQVLKAPIIVEAQSEPMPLKTKKMSISDLIQELIAKREATIKPYQLTSQEEVIIVEEALLYKAKKIIYEDFNSLTLTLREEHVSQLNQDAESLVEVVYGSWIKGGSSQSAMQETARTLGVDPLIASLSIASLSALVALIVFIMIRNKI